MQSKQSKQGQDAGYNMQELKRQSDTLTFFAKRTLPGGPTEALTDRLPDCVEKPLVNL